MGLNALKEKFKSKLVILGFPCNQFGSQEPGANSTEIMNGIKYVRPGNGFEPNFQLMEKIEVNGLNEHPLYTFLKLYCPTTRDGFASVERLLYKPLKNSDLRWNWEKFLVNQNGQPVYRYDPSTNPEEIAVDIKYLLKIKNIKQKRKFDNYLGKLVSVTNHEV